MICPMTNITHECDGDECEWWDGEQCSIRTIAEALAKIAKTGIPVRI